MTASEIWHMFAGLGGFVLSLVVGLSAWYVNSTMRYIMKSIDGLETRIENLAERVAKLEGQINGGNA